MPTGRRNASALYLQSRPDAVLVVGGDSGPFSEAPRCAELLTHTAGASGGGGGDAWRWRRLNNMHEGRNHRPGILLLLSGGDRKRVIVAGGGGSSTAEILQLSCSDPSDSGQWTRITHLSKGFNHTFLIECSNRIFAIGSFLVCITPSFSKG